jgi:hypothetical protein
MKVFATGKWSKEQKRWSMLVAIRRPGREVAANRRAGEESPSGKARPKR